MTTSLAAVLAGFLGALIGSFLNVVAYRLPRGESLSRPPSRCPGCGTPIRPSTTSRCSRGCCCAGAAATAAADLAALPARRGPDRAALRAVVLVSPDDEASSGSRSCCCWSRSRSSTSTTRISRTSSPGRARRSASCWSPRSTPTRVEHLIAAAAAGGFLFLAVLANPRGMGMGDVKLAGVMGLFLGRAVAPALLIALSPGRRRRPHDGAHGRQGGRKTAVPFGPFLALGGVIALFFGDAIVDWYAATFL